MIRPLSGRRSSWARTCLSLGLGFLLVGIVTLAALALVTWRQAEQVQLLQAQVGTLERERQTVQGDLGGLQATAVVLEDRLALLEANDPAQQLAALRSAVDNSSDPQEMAQVRAALDGIQTTVGAFQKSLDDLTARLDAQIAPQDGTEEILPSEVRLEVARQRQSHNLSCESSAASMVAQYLGVNLTESEVLDALPRNENPYLGFRGSVDGPTGDIKDYGVYAGPILAILNSSGLSAWAVEGGLEGVKAAIARGHPVIAWITYNCLISNPVEQVINGNQVTLVPNQHAVVLTGYNDDGLWANDPWDGAEDFYLAADLERAMSYFGFMAIEVAGKG
jgi:uncharacterized protein YvpB